jgi:hypothetical protein
MKTKIAAIFTILFILFVSCSGCIQISSKAGACGGGETGIGVSYVERTYLWGDDGLFTKKYDATVYVFGIPSVKTGISEYQLRTYINTYCKSK